MGEELILATMPMIPKYEAEEVLGVIYGSSTRTRGAGGQIISGIQAFTGGKGTAYAEACMQTYLDPSSNSMLKTTFFSK